MFDIGQLNFANGVYGNNGQINGMEVMIMENAQKEDDIVNDFEEILKVELSPYAALDQAFERNNVSQDDFTSYELDRISRRVNAIYKSAMNQDRRF
jgi:hypothetical protein